MRQLMLAMILGLGIFLQAAPATSADATAYWNQFAPARNFATMDQVGTSATFGQAYQGENFESDFSAVLHAIANAMNSGIPPLDDSDALGVSLANWPDS